MQTSAAQCLVILHNLLTYLEVFLLWPSFAIPLFVRFSDAINLFAEPYKRTIGDWRHLKYSIVLDQLSTREMMKESPPPSEKPGDAPETNQVVITYPSE